MGYFKKISFNNFRNFIKFSLDFTSGSNIIVGKNGSGKTNILEGISLFEKGRGFRKEKICNLINFSNTNIGFGITSIFENKDIDFNLKIFNSEKNIKKISINDNLDKDSIKNFESILSTIHFLPEMERMFVASPSFRRNFLDRLIFSSNKNYNSVINKYKKSINERQLLLKGKNYDESWIQKLENNIVEDGLIIYKKRISHIEKINIILKNINNHEFFSSNFSLKLKDEFIEKTSNFLDNNEFYLSSLKKNRNLDCYSGGCLIGPHRSDIIGFNIVDNFNLNQLSTGQQKTMVLLIIISQCIFLIKDINIKPVILLDEICSHLDDTNRQMILYLVNELQVQVLMTGTDKNFFSFLSTKANYCNIT